MALEGSRQVIIAWLTTDGLAPIAGQKQAAKLGPIAKPVGDLEGANRGVSSRQSDMSIYKVGPGKVAVLYFTLESR